jgi:acyl-coenzyme A thioesterase PaaI-like protein
LRAGRLNGDARVIRRTRALAFMEASIANARGEVAVTASSTWSIAKA